mgnify:CR=1 FL=1
MRRSSIGSLIGSNRMDRPAPSGDPSVPSTKPLIEARTRLLLGCGLIVILTLAVYIPAIRAGYIWDDDHYLTKNALVQSPGGLSRIWFEPKASPQYYPLVFTAFWIEHALWGLSPLGYHLVNVLLHACNAILVWRLLRWLRVHGAFVAGLVFAIHPVHVESVAWITERKNVLSGLFYLSALWIYLSHALPESRDATKRPSTHYGVAMAFFVCALLSKSVTATMPAVAMVIVWWKRGAITRRDVFSALLFLIVGLSAAFHTAWLEQHHVGAESVAWGLSPLDRCLVAGRVIWFYFAKLAYPAELIFFYPKWTIAADAAWQYLFPIGALGLLVAAYALRNRIGRGPAAALFCFCGTLLPVLGFVKVYPMIFSYVADHFQYLASISAIALSTGIAAKIHFERDGSTRLFLCVISVVVLATFGFKTWQRCGVYQDEETLWRDTIKRNPSAWAAYNNLGMLLHDRGSEDEAVSMLTKAIEARPDYEIALDNLGLMLLQRNRPDEAFELFRRATEANRYYSSAQRNYGRMLCDRGRIDEGIRHIEAAILIQPRKYESYEDLGNAYFRSGRAKEAVQSYRTVLELNPDYPLGMSNLAAALAAIGNADEAIVLLKHALAIQQTNPLAHSNLAVLLAGLGRVDEALEHFQTAARQAPDDADAHFNLARTLEGHGERDAAMREYREVLRINPNDPEARKALEGIGDIGAKP